MSRVERDEKEKNISQAYEAVMEQWRPFEEFVQLRERKFFASNVIKKKSTASNATSKQQHSDNVSLCSENSLLLLSDSNNVDSGVFFDEAKQQQMLPHVDKLDNSVPGKKTEFTFGKSQFVQQSKTLFFVAC